MSLHSYSAARRNMPDDVVNLLRYYPTFTDRQCALVGSEGCWCCRYLGTWHCPDFGSESRVTFDRTSPVVIPLYWFDLVREHFMFGKDAFAEGWYEMPLP